METLHFVTSNQGKIDIFNQFLKEVSLNYNFEMLKLDFEELKTDDSIERTALNKVNTCMDLIDKDNIIVSDVGLFIEALNGFPGVNTGFVIRTIGNQGILRLMDGKTNRKAYFEVSLALGRKDGTRRAFTAKADIEIALTEEGDNGFAWDRIALGNGERFSDNIDNEKRLFPFKNSIKRLIEFIEEQNSSSLKQKVF